jgi:hypothetical protein
MRAAAFSYGVLSEFDGTEIRSKKTAGPLLDRVDFLSGVSGGAITAAYFGLKGRVALSDSRERFLLRNAEESLATRFTPTNVFRAYEGGVNDAEQFPRWLDDNLFQGPLSVILIRSAVGVSGSMHQISTIERHLFSAKIPSALYVATWPLIRSPARLRHPQRCQLFFPPSCCKRFPISVPQRSLVGSSGRRTILAHLRYSRNPPPRSPAIGTARCPSLSFSTEG